MIYVVLQMCVVKFNLKYGIAYFIIQEAADFRNDCQIELKPKTYYAYSTIDSTMQNKVKVNIQMTRLFC